MVLTLAQAKVLKEKIRKDYPHVEVSVEDDPGKYTCYLDVTWVKHRRIVIRSLDQWEERKELFENFEKPNEH